MQRIPGPYFQRRRAIPHDCPQIERAKLGKMLNIALQAAFDLGLKHTDLNISNVRFVRTNIVNYGLGACIHPGFW